ncbi:hypothetical protein [Haloarchaeobius sp. DFWS5]|uniref:hypothetical protein n=1 Tax=Haloarchaeobius sp. DFWS5 TaxID=3446114 RepID=UPI003EBE86AF
MARTRRALLAGGASVALAAVAGCLSDADDGQPDPGAPPQTSTGTASTTAATAGFPDTEVPFPEGPKDRPERPDELTEGTVRAFVRTHEYRYVYNDLWSESVLPDSVTVSVTVGSVQRAEDGFEVVVSRRGSATYEVDGTKRYGDLWTAAFVYYVDTDSVVRQRATDDSEDTGTPPTGTHPRKQ